MYLESVVIDSGLFRRSPKREELNKQRYLAGAEQKHYMNREEFPLYFSKLPRLCFRGWTLLCYSTLKCFETNHMERATLLPSVKVTTWTRHSRIASIPQNLWNSLNVWRNRNRSPCCICLNKDTITHDWSVYFYDESARFWKRTLH